MQSKKINRSEKIESNASNKIRQIASKTVDASKTIEQYTIKTVKAVKAKYFLTCIENLLAESKEMTTSIGKSLRINTVNWTDPTIQQTIFHLKKEPNWDTLNRTTSPSGV